VKSLRAIANAAAKTAKLYKASVICPTRKPFPGMKTYAMTTPNGTNSGGIFLRDLSRCVIVCAVNGLVSALPIHILQGRIIPLWSSSYHCVSLFRFRIPVKHTFARSIVLDWWKGLACWRRRGWRIGCLKAVAACRRGCRRNMRAVFIVAVFCRGVESVSR
jgi:hypothetical protein